MRTQKWNVQECCYLKKDLATIYVVDYHYPKTSQRGGYRGKGEDRSEFVGGNAVDVETDIRTMKGRREDRVPRCQLQTQEREYTRVDGNEGSPSGRRTGQDLQYPRPPLTIVSP